MIRYSVNMSCNQGNINYARFILLMHDHADQLSCIRLDSIIPFVVVYKFTFDFSLFHCKVTVICCIAITLIIGSLSVFLGSESVFSIFVSISV